MAPLKLPKLVEKELQPLTPDEELALLNAYSEVKAGECRRDKASFMLMLSTGLRRAELLGLEDAAVNLGEGFITVIGKGKKQRSIPFGFKTGWALQRYRSLHRPELATPRVRRRPARGRLRDPARRHRSGPSSSRATATH